MTFVFSVADHECMNIQTMSYLIVGEKGVWDRSKAPWIEKVYVDAVKMVLPAALFESHFLEHGDGRIYRVKEAITSEAVATTEAECHARMHDYKDAIKSYLVNVPVSGYSTCHCWDQYTWALEPRSRRVFYPGSVRTSAERWTTMFHGRDTWTRIPFAYHSIWRNILIPGHEFVHLQTRAKTTNDNEWLASAGNLAVFLAAVREQDKDDKYLALFALQGVMYVHGLVQTIANEVRRNGIAESNRIDLLDRWARAEPLTREEEAIVECAVSKEPDGIRTFAWENTFAKHLVALYYAYPMFLNPQDQTLLRSVLNQNILRTPKEHLRGWDFWLRKELPPLSNWLDFRNEKIGYYYGLQSTT